MAPRNSNAMSVSTTSSSLYTEDVPVSIDVISLDDPAAMSPQAMKAELNYYGVSMNSMNNDRDELEQALAFARRRSTSSGSSPRGVGGGAGQGGGLTKNHHHRQGGTSGGKPQHKPQHIPQQQQHPQYQRQKNMQQLPQQHLEQTAANLGLRVTSPPASHSQQHANNRKYSTNNSGDNPTHIPLSSNNRIPPQILNIIRISADPTMKAINMDHRNLGDREVMKLAEAMGRNSTIEFLSLRNCAISDDAVSKLADMLLRNTTLLELHLDDNRISGEGAAALSTALITNETLQVLTLNENEKVGDKGVVYLIGALEHNTTLRTLGVENCGIVVKGGGNGGSRNSRNHNRLEQIETLLADRQIDSNFESLLERLLDDDFRVTGIDLSGRRIGDKGAVRLAEALADNTQVRQLWLRGCNVGDPGARALALCLEQNMAIVDLFLGNNSIGNEGLVAISDALALSNLTLVSLEMDDNHVKEGGLDAFSRALVKNTSVLVASFANNPIGNSGKVETLQAMLAEKRNSQNFVSFVVDPDGGSTVGTYTDGGNDGNKAGLMNMSVCSSYMPSTYRRAGLSSQAGDLRGSGDRMSNYGVYDMENGGGKVNVPPPPPPPYSERRSPPAQQQVAPQAAVASPRVSPKSHSTSANNKSRGSVANKSKGSSRSRSPRRPEPTPQRAAAPPQPMATPAKKKVASPPRAPSPPPYSRSNPYQRAHVPVPLKAQALETIAEQRSIGTARSSAMSSRKSSSVQKRNSSVAVVHPNYPLAQEYVPVMDEYDYEEEDATPLRGKRRRTGTSVANSEFGHSTITESIKHPQTQRNFNTTLKKLWRRVEMMKRTNHFAAAHYRARHFWFWFVPISSSIFMAVLLSLATAVDISGSSTLGLSLFTGLFAAVAFLLNFLQARFGWSSRAEVHRSAEVELCQVAFRLDTLGKYEGRGLATGSHSTKSRANAIRDLYRIDVYLQAMQRCTPDIPDSINETFFLLASRLKGICTKYPNAVKLRSAYASYDDEPNPENPVPVEMQIDALDLLGREIENYFLYPLFMPNARDVVSRTIDIFFAKSDEGGGGERGGGEASAADSRDFYSHGEYDDQGQIV